MNILVVFDHIDGKKFKGTGGPVFRFMFDLQNKDQVMFAMDTGPD